MQRWLFLGTGLFVGLVGLVLLLNPQAYMQVYATQYAPGMDFPARRFAPAVLALGVVLVLARSLEDAQIVGQLCLVGAAAFIGVALTGVHAWFTGLARPPILGAAAVEAIIAGLLLWLRRRIRSQ